MDIQGTRADDLLYGGAGDDKVWGGDGDDTIDGRAGLDRVSYRFDTLSPAGGGGAYVHGAAVYFDARRLGGRVNTEIGDGRGGIDRLIAVEGLEVVGTRHDDSIRGGTRALSNHLTGDGGDDRLWGGDGDDVLMGDGAVLWLSDTDADTLFGGSGNDALIGGRDGDRMTGGAGADRFTYLFLDRDVSESGFAFGDRDQIMDFARAEGDRIDLSALGARADGRDLLRFRFVEEFTGGVAEVRSVTVGSGASAYALALADLDGDMVADLVVAVQGVDALMAADFIL